MIAFRGSKAVPTIGICVLNWNSGGALEQCLESLQDELPRGRLCFVVVDNASTDNSVAIVRRRFPSVRIISNSFNQGYAAGNNVGARYLLAEKCNFLIFLNPDVIVSYAAVKALAGSLAQHPRIGCAGGISVTQSGEASPCARSRPSPLEKIVYYGPLHRIGILKGLCREHFLDPESLDDDAEVYAVSGSCIALRSEAFVEVGGFDETTFLYEEEFILAERLTARGWRTVLSKTATYLHAEGGATSLIPYRRRLHFIASEQHLVRHYYHWNSLQCAGLRVLRFLEWLGYAVKWSLTGHAARRPQKVTGVVSNSFKDARG